MFRIKAILTGTALVLFAGAYASFAAVPGEGLVPVTREPDGPMTFFVTSVGLGKGGDLGGLVGADAHCQRLAEAAGSTKTFRAYLSTQARPDEPAVNARDRIGRGPWHNANESIIAWNQGILHGDILELARLGNSMWKLSVLDEKKKVVPGEGDPGKKHDILTGSTLDGRAFSGPEDRTCSNWTSGGPGSVRVGHSDRIGAGNASWNSAEDTEGCSQEAFERQGGAGLFYCFAVN